MPLYGHVLLIRICKLALICINSESRHVIVTLQQLKSPEIERKVAEILAQIHLVRIPDDMPKHWGFKHGLQRCISELKLDSNLDPRYQAMFDGENMLGEFQCITEWIEDCKIPIAFNHGDCDSKNLIYDEETGVLNLVDYEFADSQVFTHDIGRYFLGYVGIPFDFTKYPDDARLRQFVRFLFIIILLFLVYHRFFRLDLLHLYSGKIYYKNILYHLTIKEKQ